MKHETKTEMLTTILSLIDTEHRTIQEAIQAGKESLPDCYSNFHGFLGAITDMPIHLQRMQTLTAAAIDLTKNTTEE